MAPDPPPSVGIAPPGPLPSLARRAPRAWKRAAVPAVTYLLTWGTTTFVGMWIALDPSQVQQAEDWRALARAGFPGGLLFSVPLMAALTVHELGHFIAQRHYRVPGTLPIFLPLPLPPFGTLGALIVMRGRIPSRRALFDIGASGPWAGLALAIPFTLWGLRASEVIPGNADAMAGLRFGSSWLFDALAWAALGPVPADATLNLHPTAFAGWAAIYVTGLNLLPVGQLDGGHVAYSLLGTRAHHLYRFLLAGMIGLTLFYAAGWCVVVALLLVFARSHPAPRDDREPLDFRRRILATATLVLFCLTFVPRPFESWTGLVHLIVDAMG